MNNLFDELMYGLNRSCISSEPGAVFCEDEYYPEMVVIAGGTLERPGNAADGCALQQPVQIKKFSLSKTPVKLAHWEVLFGSAQDSHMLIGPPEYGRILQMKLCDACDFVARLRQRTGRDYRLPSSHELEFVLGEGRSRLHFWENRDEEGSATWPMDRVAELNEVFIALSLPEPRPNAENEVMINEFILGEVSADAEHIELSYGDMSTAKYKSFVKIARLGVPVSGKLTVQFLIALDDAANATMLEESIKQMKNYLVVNGYSRPWFYAKHHCGTSANLYSKLHWSYFDGK